MPASLVSRGNMVDYTPESDVTAGSVVVQGELVGVANLDIPAGKLGALTVSGVFDFPKATGEITAGANVYWDAAEGEAGTDDDSGANKLIGKAVKTAASGDSTVRVRLSQ